MPIAINPIGIIKITKIKWKPLIASSTPECMSTQGKAKLKNAIIPPTSEINLGYCFMLLPIRKYHSIRLVLVNKMFIMYSHMFDLTYKHIVPTGLKSVQRNRNTVKSIYLCETMFNKKLFSTTRNLCYSFVFDSVLYSGLGKNLTPAIVRKNPTMVSGKPYSTKSRLLNNSTIRENNTDQTATVYQGP